MEGTREEASLPGQHCAGDQDAADGAELGHAEALLVQGQLLGDDRLQHGVPHPGQVVGGRLRHAVVQQGQLQQLQAPEVIPACDQCESL